MTAPFVMFATPSLEHKNCVEFTGSMLETSHLLKDNGINHTLRFRAGDQFVAKARNKLLTEFLEREDATHLFFIDDDLGWPAEAALRLLRYDVDVVAGVYPKKQESLDWPVRLAVSKETGGLMTAGNLYMAHELVPTGFLCIKRHVIERLVEGAPKFQDLEFDGSVKEFYYVFQSGLGPDGWFWGEDFTFGNRWNALGGQIWVDPDIPFTHRGNKKWSGNLNDSIPIFKEKARDAVSALPPDHEASGRAGIEDHADPKSSVAA